MAANNGKTNKCEDDGEYSDKFVEKNPTQTKQIRLDNIWRISTLLFKNNRQNNSSNSGIVHSKIVTSTSFK